MPKPKPGEPPMYAGALDCVKRTVAKEGFFALYKVSYKRFHLESSASILWSSRLFYASNRCQTPITIVYNNPCKDDKTPLLRPFLEIVRIDCPRMRDSCRASLFAGGTFEDEHEGFRNWFFNTFERSHGCQCDLRLLNKVYVLIGGNALLTDRRGLLMRRRVDLAASFADRDATAARVQSLSCVAY